MARSLTTTLLVTCAICLCQGACSPYHYHDPTVGETTKVASRGGNAHDIKDIEAAGATIQPGARSTSSSPAAPAKATTTAAKPTPAAKPAKPRPKPKWVTKTKFSQKEGGRTVYYGVGKVYASAPTASLIAKAKKKAEKRARTVLARWLRVKAAALRGVSIVEHWQEGEKVYALARYRR